MPDQQFKVESPAKRASPENGSNADSRVVFGLGPTAFSISASLVSEIIPPQPITPLPNCPALIEGVSVLRGELIALLNIRSIVNIPQTTPTQRSKWIVLSASAGSTQFAFPVDRLVEIAPECRADGDSAQPNRPLQSRKQPEFPMLDINSIVANIESALQ